MCVALFCYEGNNPRTDIQLVNGSNSAIGQVIVFYNNTWGSICDNNWGLANAMVVCRSLCYK